MSASGGQLLPHGQCRRRCPHTHLKLSPRRSNGVDDCHFLRVQAASERSTHKMVIRTENLNVARLIKNARTKGLTDDGIAAGEVGG